jgi:transposase, IS5 family
MERKGLMVKEGTLIDATVVQAAVKREAKDRNGDPQDGDAEFGGKDGKTFGYKAHAAVDEGSHLIREVKVTDASVHDSQMMEEVCPEETTSVYADKGYASKARRSRLRRDGVAARILFKAARNRPFTKREARLNAAWSRVRAKVEAAFASMKRWCGMPRIRYLGMDGARVQVFLAALLHNLKRSVKLREAAGEVFA